MKDSLRPARNMLAVTDKMMLLICLALSVFSCVILYACYQAGFVRFGVFTMQVTIAVIGFFAAVVISMIDYRLIAKFWPVMVAVSLILCALLLTPLGYMPSGSDDLAWLRFGSFSFQPSEVVKLTFIYTFALHISKVKEHINKLPNFLLLCLHGAAYCMLIMFQGDFGTATVFFAIFVIMMFAGGLAWRFIIVGLVGVIAMIPIVWYVVLPDYLQRRFFVAWDPSIDPLGDGYQQYRGQLALGSGQLTGKGLFAEDLIYVPEGHNDFIFANIGQVLGFVGCIIAIFLLMLVCMKILLTARKARDTLGRMICCGVFAIICYQSIVNIGMVLCVIPVIGITLPFISGGGTSLLVSFIGVGMVLGVHRDSKKYYMFSDTL